MQVSKKSAAMTNSEAYDVFLLVSTVEAGMLGPTQAYVVWSWTIRLGLTKYLIVNPDDGVKEQEIRQTHGHNKIVTPAKWILCVPF